jgi:TonB-dependent SusC/RagA subfamily outer membrane receptor
MRVSPVSAGARIARKRTSGRGLGPLRFARAAGLVACLACALPVAGQEPGSIVGRVLDAATGQPVGAADVSIAPVPTRAITNDLGWFVFPELQPGHYVVETGRVGYASDARVVAVAGDAVLVEVRLAPRPIPVPGVDVVGGAAPGAAVVRIDLSELPAPSGKAIDLLRRLVGVDVFQGSGEPGSSASVRLRGSTSIAERREPLVIVDGAPTSLLTLRDMPASDVASIEVLKGAAAAAQYGSRGQAGVIVVRTKRGATR